MSGSDANAANEWVHRPQREPVAWGAAVLVAPAVPFGSFLVLLFIIAVARDGRVESAALLSPLPWLVIGGLLASLGSGRIVRGVGVGLSGGAVATLVMAVIASYGGWR